MAFRPHLPHRSKVPQHIRREQKEGAFVSIAAAILLDHRRGFEANPILPYLHHYYYYPTKALPSLPSCFKNDDTFCNAMILETIFSNWQKMMGWGRCWTPSRTSQNHLVFAQHFSQNHQSLLSSMPKKKINSSEPKRFLQKKTSTAPNRNRLYVCTFTLYNFWNM